MIVDEGKYYLYRHIRLDKNEPFYIGIGTKQEINREYRRAYTTRERNDIWKKIVKKTDYNVEILLETDDYNFLQEKEKEFIKKYGRIIKQNGTLANIETGGLRPNRDLQPYSKSIFCCNNGKKYNSIKEASKELNLRRDAISKVLAKKFKNIEGYVFKFCFCNKNSLPKVDLKGWYPIINKKYNYYINKKGKVKRVFEVKNKTGNSFFYEKVIKVVKRKTNSFQVTISYKNKKFSVNIRKVYNKLFDKDWDEL